MASNLFTGYLVAFVLLLILYFGLSMIVNVEVPDRVELAVEDEKRKEKRN